MIQTIEAVIDEAGMVRLSRPVRLQEKRRALVTILDDAPMAAGECALLSEAVLAEDWERPEEDAAWASWQPVR